MAITSRLLRTSKPLSFNPSSSSSSSVNFNGSSSSVSVRCVTKSELVGDKIISGIGERKPNVAVKATVSSESLLSTETKTKSGVDLASVVAYVADTALKILRPALKRKSWRRQAEMFVEKAVVDCRFFTLFAVGGSLLGSILCFVEGCFLIIESYIEYFQTISKRSDEGHVVQLLIEAIDMFLVGCAMLIFGMGLYAMFVGSRKRENGGLVPGSNLFGFFHLKTLPMWAEMQCISQAKSKMGHAILMILQVGVVEKFKNVPLVTGLDLACFAGAILLSSACIFVLSRLSTGGR